MKYGLEVEILMKFRYQDDFTRDQAEAAQSLLQMVLDAKKAQVGETKAAMIHAMVSLDPRHPYVDLTSAQFMGPVKVVEESKP